MNKLVYHKRKKRGIEESQLAWLWLQHCGQRPWSYPEPFLWVVGKLYTHSLQVGPEIHAATQCLTVYEALSSYLTHSILTQLTAWEADRRETIF